MKSYVEVITTPTVDTPGTVLLLHFDDRRYLIGNVSEGTQRACNERGIGFRKISSILVTGRTEWSNLGGLLGMILELADTKNTAQAAQSQASSGKARTQNQADLSKLDIYGTANLNHLIATSRRFIFRTGVPMNAVEFRNEDDERRLSTTDSAPTWEDERIKVWTMVSLPSSVSQRHTYSSSPRKRSYDELVEEGKGDRLPEKDPLLSKRKAIVAQMFNSTWRFDKFVQKPLSEVKFPAKIFVRDAETRQLSPYNGPIPGSGISVPDVTVLVREPWPGALIEQLKPPKRSFEAISYIVRNHPQRGKFQPEQALHFRVPRGPLWSRLANGHTVQNEQGEEITPEMVLEPGKQGGGFAVVDLPTNEYIDSLIARPEWSNVDIMDGVKAIIWILGSGVGLDARLKKFQGDMAHLMHIVASPDFCPNIIALEAAATNALRHHFVDDKVFPLLQYSPIHDHAIEQPMSDPSSGVITAQRGHVITLEPKVELRTSGVKQPLHLPSLRTTITKEFDTLGISPVTFGSSPPPPGIDDSQMFVAHGDAEIIILGTGSSHPARCRNVSGTLIRVPGCGSYLLDCGEGTLGTLRRMFSSSEVEVILRDLKMVWISHLHADHHLGLASIVKAWSQAIAPGTRASSKTESSDTFVPMRTSENLAIVSDDSILHWLHEYASIEDLPLAQILALETLPSPDLKTSGGGHPTVLRIVTTRQYNHEIDDHQSTAKYLDLLNLRSLDSVYVNHCRGAQAVSLTFKSGLKISYSGDCRPSVPFAAIGRDSHVLIHEATFQDDMRNEALAKKHSTTGEALVVAHEMKARTCLLTHFSQRYPEMPQLGTKIREHESSVATQGLKYVLGEQDGKGPLASMNTNDDEAVLRHNETEGLQASQPNQSRSGDIASNSLLTLEATCPSPSTKLEFISEEDIKDMLSASGMKVIFAFDYMRLKLKDIPLLEAKQPLLRKIYDESISKDAYPETNCT